MKYQTHWVATIYKNYCMKAYKKNAITLDYVQYMLRNLFDLENQNILHSLQPENIKKNLRLNEQREEAELRIHSTWVPIQAGEKCLNHVYAIQPCLFIK